MKPLQILNNLTSGKPKQRQDAVKYLKTPTALQGIEPGATVIKLQVGGQITGATAWSKNGKPPVHLSAADCDKLPGLDFITFQIPSVEADLINDPIE